MTPVHETLPDARVFHERLVVHAIIQEQKGTRFPTSGYDSPLALKHLFDSVSLVITVDEKVGNELLVVMITILGT